ncbi:hypothetical protein E2P81_ATG04471 [Venturia nashicola]|uniref:Uncharacterized protein n=1 Tax=Venturia nashicola TaxID=86259 RepID=A0A4Z1PR52_9PEZI|nr:hypothetical protein E6O75_ATG04577 [Venturia nashicola]TLD37659.1 hypothetical protein E2P81_ATG04471 [Venturia nashicola]
MDFVLEDVMLPDKPIMLRWRQTGKISTDLNPSPVSSAKNGMSSFSVSLPKTTESPKKKSPESRGAKFVNFTAANPHQKKTLIKSKEKSKASTSPKGRSKSASKAKDREVQQPVVKTPIDVLEPSKYQGLQAVTRYPSPLDRYFFKATPFPFTSLDSLNTGHYTNYYLHGIANMMYPLNENLAFNPIRDRWFEIILKDETWFFTIIYVAARQLEVEHGANQSSQQVSRLMMHVLERLKKAVEKAQQGHIPPDSIIGAISCLVSLENGLNNTTTWQVHSRGLSELVRAKGGIQSIDSSLRTKVCRSDIEGAVDTLTLPVFPPVPPTSTQLTPVTQSTTHSLSASLDATLSTIAKDIADFTILLNDMLEYHIPVDPVDLDEHLMIFFHRLLSFTPDPHNPLDHAFKIASLLFLKSLMRPLSTLAQTSAFLASNLKSSLCLVRDAPRSLTLWLGFWGLQASREGSEERGWFTDKILADVMVLKGRMCAWDELRIDLVKVFWVGNIFDAYSRIVWEELERGIIVSRISEA